MANGVAECTGPTVYCRRQPERTVLHQVVRENLETWLERHADREGFSVSDRIEAEFRCYLTCGIAAHGSMRARLWLPTSTKERLSLELGYAQNNAGDELHRLFSIRMSCPLLRC